MLRALPHMLRGAYRLWLNFEISLADGRAFDIYFSVRVEIIRDFNLVKCRVLWAACHVFDRAIVMVQSHLLVSLLPSHIHHLHRVIETFLSIVVTKLLR